MVKILNKKSFTLIELIIVVIIVGIISAVMVWPALEGMIVKAYLTEMFTTAGYFDRQVDMLMLEYGSDDLSLIRNKVYDIRVKEGLISTENFNYYLSYTSEYVAIRFRAWKCSAFVPQTSYVAERRWYRDKKTWIIYDNCPWAPYVNIPDAEHHS